MKLDTERLVLRPLKESDEADLYPIFNDPEVTHNLLISYPYPRQRMLPWIRERIEAYRHRERYVFAMELKESRKVIGVCGLVAVTWEHMNAELIYWLGKSHWNKGYVTEAARRMIRFGFEDLGLERISVGCFARNTASSRVIEKLEFQPEGRVRHEFLKDGEYLDAIHYGMIREEYLKICAERS